MTHDEQLVSQVTSLLVLLWVALSVATLPFAVRTIVILQRDRSLAAFFIIYKVGLVIDILTLLCTHLICTIPSRGWLIAPEVMETKIYLKLFSFTMYASHTCQNFAYFWLCINRATAVLLPLMHHKIWSNRIVLRCCFIFQFVTSFLVGKKSTHFDMHIVRYSAGELCPQFIDSPALRSFWKLTCISALINAVFLAALYGVVIWRFRVNSMAAAKSRRAIVEHRRAITLLKIAVTVVGLQLLCCVYHFYSFVTNVDFKQDLRILYTILFGVSFFYSSLPTFLLLIFCKPIRDQVYGHVRVSYVGGHSGNESIVPTVGMLTVTKSPTLIVFSDRKA